MQRMPKKQLYVAGSLAPLLEADMTSSPIQESSRKRRRKKRKAVCMDVKENCSNEELRVILETIDGNRDILRTSDGRRVRTKTLTVKRSLKERMIQQNELAQRSRKIKKAMFESFINQPDVVASQKADATKVILPIEQALTMVEVLGAIQEEVDFELF